MSARPVFALAKFDAAKLDLGHFVAGNNTSPVVHHAVPRSRHARASEGPQTQQRPELAVRRGDTPIAEVQRLLRGFFVCSLLQQSSDNEISTKVKAEDGGNDHAVAMHRVENAVIEGPQNQAAKSGMIERAGSWKLAKLGFGNSNRAVECFPSSCSQILETAPCV
jgi:hypothetical protein